MKKFLLGTIFLVGSISLVSAQAEDRDPRAPKPPVQGKVTAPSPANQAQQEELNASKNRPSKTSFKAKSNKSEDAVVAPVTKKPVSASSRGTAAKTKTVASATTVADKPKHASKVDVQSTDAYKASDASKPTKKN